MIPASSPASGAASPTGRRLALVVVTAIFFMWGFLTCLNDILIPHLKAVFELNYAQAVLVQSTFFGAYFLMALPAGNLVTRLGYKKGIVLGLAIAGIGTLGFWPAAELRVYGAFLGALFVLATGITVLQVAANPYVALLGPASSSSSRLTLAQALNAAGTAVAPLFGGWLILSGTVRSGEEIARLPAAGQIAYRAQEAQAVQGPYLGLAVALFVLALVVYLFRLPAIGEADAHAQPREPALRGLRDALRHRHVRFGVLAIFFYVGAEVSVGSFMVSYLSLPQIGALSERQATHYVSAYWTLAMVGRFVGSALLARIPPRLMLAAFAAVNALLLAWTMTHGGMAAVYGIVAIGLFNSIMFPTIFALGIERMGALTGAASSLLVMAIVGGAVVPYLQGLLADRIGLHLSFVLPLLCYAYIVFYGLRGSRPAAAAPG